ncbi:MAG: hypothetical protein LKF53_09790 [Solobacterium sp.]|jgi:hypothetical protein|nr:hypothetical protein [Solobacterium sp.]MCH4206661.1 hypothetical protein [Solobacterium sp.]MCH4228078.1 hypothetical protein [Solobacterium sp.]MCH4283513.1 hypothetical protein [Solobacterium sp.]
MTDQENLLAVLEKIAHTFNAAEIHWAVGASMLLYFHGITDVFHDIDLMMDTKDTAESETLLKELGAVKMPIPASDIFKNQYFAKWKLDGACIDVMAGMIIVYHGKEENCFFNEEDINGSARLGKEIIPLYSLQKWRYFYDLMGRDVKVRMIDDANSMIHD